MTHKERMRAAIRGEPTDLIPWAPRLDLWFKANQQAGKLPRKYRRASLRQMVEDLDWGLHSVVPDFRDFRSPDDDLDRGLGIFNLRTMPYRTVLENVRRTVRLEGARTTVTYETPLGSVQTVVLYDDAMRRAGITISHVERQAFQSERDYAPLGYIFENARVEAHFDGFEEFADATGDLGLPVAWVSAAGSPMHFILRELMRMDSFFYEMHDRPEALATLARQVEGYLERVKAIVLQCPAEVFLVGANYDATVTYPPFFRDHILPWLRAFAHDLHAQAGPKPESHADEQRQQRRRAAGSQSATRNLRSAIANRESRTRTRDEDADDQEGGRGRWLLTHTDGENSGLLGHYLDAEVDIADSICPAPMTRLTLRQVRDAFGGRITIMGGIPSVALLPDAMPGRDFERFLDAFFTDIGRGDHLILGVSDTTPPAADFRRLCAIARRIASFGPVNP